MLQKKKMFLNYYLEEFLLQFFMSIKFC